MNHSKKVIGFIVYVTIIGIFLSSALTFAAESQKVDINSANKAQLMMLKGVGEKVAMNIIAYREKNGEFKTSEDIMKVRGIGPKILANNRELIWIGPNNISLKKK
ncbi:MAG: helix-hairpin-helix domain-containing protein [Desulfobacteraceae bacterium]|jgi:competence protein ComEA